MKINMMKCVVYLFLGFTAWAIYEHGGMFLVFIPCLGVGLMWVVLDIIISLCNREGERRWDAFHAKRMPIYRRKRQLIWRSRGELQAGNEAESQRLMDEYNALTEPKPEEFGVSFSDKNHRSVFPW